MKSKWVNAATPLVVYVIPLQIKFAHQNNVISPQCENLIKLEYADSNIVWKMELNACIACVVVCNDECRLFLVWYWNEQF